MDCGRPENGGESSAGDNRPQPGTVTDLDHDLRSPLYVIRGYVELLLDGAAGPVNRIQRAQLLEIKNACECLRDVLDEYFRHSGTDTGV